MLRGFIGGALSGGVLGLGLSTVASVLAPPPEAPEVSDAAPAVAQAPAEDGTTEVVAQAPEETPEETPVAQSSDAVTAPEEDTLSEEDVPSTAPATVPQTSVADGLAAPADAIDRADVELAEDEPVLQNPLALAPMVPQPADDLTISTAPADPPAPVVAEEPEAVSEDAETAEIVEDAEVAKQQDVASAEPEAETPSAEEQMPQLEAEAEEPSEPVTEAQVTDAPAEETEVAQAETPQATEETSDVDASREQADAETATPEPEAPAVIAEEEPAAEQEEEPQVAMIAPASRPQIGTPAVSLTERNTGITVRRPTTQTDAAVTETEGDGDVTDAAAPSGDPRPIGQFGQPFDNPDEKPLMSIVLIDAGANPTSGAPGIAALRSFPYALSFAVDSSLPDAAERMALYRAEGFEVLAMVDLPEGAQPTDAETTLNATLSQLPEVIGVLEGTGTGLQASRPVADQVTAILAQTGHGLVTQSRGLNTMPKLARKEGVPATPIFRDFDSKDQTATVIRRFLDQAAFRAGQEGAVIMLGRLRPDTISALLLWGLQDRAGQVALAPVSAVLLIDPDG